MLSQRYVTNHRLDISQTPHLSSKLSPNSMSSIALITVLLAISVTYKVIASRIKRKLRATFIAPDDLPWLARPREDKRKRPGTAVIYGGMYLGPQKGKYSLTNQMFPS